MEKTREEINGLEKKKVEKTKNEEAETETTELVSGTLLKDPKQDFSLLAPIERTTQHVFVEPLESYLSAQKGNRLTGLS